MNEPWWKSYFRFSATERRGLAVLLPLLAVLLALRFSLTFWVRPPEDELPDSRLLAAWQAYQKPTRPLAKDTVTRVVSLFEFDPNTIDSMGCIRLGLRPVTIRMLLNWRRKGKRFYQKDDLRPLYTLSPEEYARLEPYIRIREAEKKYAMFPQPPSLPDRIDLNTADSAVLVRLRGIGPVLAHKIVSRRLALGGYHSHEQLKEIYTFPDTTYDMLRERLYIDPSSVRKLHLNRSDFEELRAHPYIGEQLAGNIILYREGLGGFTEIRQLRQVPLMNEEIYRKIAPYFTLD